MRFGKLSGIIALLALGVLAGILLDRLLLPKPASTRQPAARKPTIKAAEIPQRLERISKASAGERFREIDEFTKGLEPGALPAAVEKAAAVDSSVRSWLMVGLFQQWAQHDPSAALNSLPKVPADEQSACADAVLKAWPKRDLKMLISWAERNTNAPVSRGVLAHGVREVATSDPKGALALASKLPPDDRKKIWPFILAVWKEGSPEPCWMKLIDCRRIPRWTVNLEVRSISGCSANLQQP
jgi:hypothetical protein